MRRVDWGDLRWALWRPVIYTAIAWAFYGCVRTFVPSGKPSCPNRTLWSDSAQRCIAREGR